MSHTYLPHCPGCHEDLQRAAGGADTALFLANQAAKIRALEARAEAAEQERDELAANGAAIVGALEERDMARAERDEAHARIRDLEAALRETHDALERLDAIYASEHDPDPVLGTVLRPAWLADALHHARALLTPAPDEKGRHCGETDPDGIGYVCTLPPGHDGGHVAHVLLGEVAHRWTTPTAPVGDADKQPRAPGCQCQWEAGDSPCRVHGEEEGTAPEGGERVTMTIDVDALNAAPAVQCIRCNAPCSECATPTQKGGGE